MRKRLSILVALAVSAMMAVATIVPAFADAYYFGNVSATSCGSGDYAHPGVDFTPMTSTTRVGAVTYNTNLNDCYWIFARGFVILNDNSEIQLQGGGWVSGYQGHVNSDQYTGTNIKAMDNQFNFCESSGTVCYGFDDYIYP